MFSKTESDAKPIMFISNDSKEISNHTVEQVHSTGRSAWQGWYCSAGMRSLYIDFDGNVFIGTCNVGGWYGNVFREGLNPDKNLNQWIRCTAKSCSCGADMFAPKVKDKNLIPPNFQDIYKCLEGQGGFRRAEDVHKPDMVLSEVTRRVKMIIWDLGRRCNYSCSYCFPGSHNNYEAHKSMGSLTHAVDGLHDWWLCDEPGKFIITGGEPTLNPQYLEFVKYIRLKRKGNMIHTTTNGSRDPNFFHELMIWTDITFSAHTESLENSRTYERFLENIEACLEAKRINDLAVQNCLQVRIMLKPGTLPLVKNLLKDIRAIPEFAEYGIVNCDLLHQSGDKSSMKPYTEEETRFVATNA